MGLFREFLCTMADAPKKRTFCKFFSVASTSMRSLTCPMMPSQPCSMLVSGVRRAATATRKPRALLKRLRKAKQECAQFEKPVTIKTHLRGMIVVPEMSHSVVGVYNGKTFNAVKIKPEMVGHYLGEFSITYKPVKHGRPGIGATNSSRFVPL